MAMRSFWTLFILVFLTFAPAKAQEMAFPLVCEPGLSCWIIGYPDVSRDHTGQDYACGPGAAPGDLFLRIGLANVSVIPRGVYVLAAGNGVVQDVSNDAADLVIASKAQLKTGASLCGNGIIINHGMGTQTAYCHLRKDSIRVKKGDRVVKGQVIAAAGQSGLATWPQLGFSIQKGGYFLDPVTGVSPEEGCGLKPRPLIALPAPFMEYQPVSIVALGFSNAKAVEQRVVLGKEPRVAVIDRMDKTINLWGMVLGLRKGDEIEVRMRDPRGRSFYFMKLTADQDRDRQLINVSRDRGYVGWRIGTYTGEVKVTRNVNLKRSIATRAVTVIIQ
jgi:hypothetical protein